MWPRCHTRSTSGFKTTRSRGCITGYSRNLIYYSLQLAFFPLFAFVPYIYLIVPWYVALFLSFHLPLSGVWLTLEADGRFCSKSGRCVYDPVSPALPFPFLPFSRDTRRCLWSACSRRCIQHTNLCLHSEEVAIQGLNWSCVAVCVHMCVLRTMMVVTAAWWTSGARSSKRASSALSQGPTESKRTSTSWVSLCFGPLSFSIWFFNWLFISVTFSLY